MNQLEPHTPTSRRWSEDVVHQLFRTIVNHDGLATRHNVQMEYFWDAASLLCKVRVWVDWNTPDAVVLATIERDPDRNLKADLIEEFKTVRKLVMLL